MLFLTEEGVVLLRFFSHGYRLTAAEEEQGEWGNSSSARVGGFRYPRPHIHYLAFYSEI